MPDLTPRIGLEQPLGNEIVSRAAYNKNLQILDAAMPRIVISKEKPQIPGPYIWICPEDEEELPDVDAVLLVGTDEESKYFVLVDGRRINIANMTDNLETAKPGDIIVLDYK